MPSWCFNRITASTKDTEQFQWFSGVAQRSYGGVFEAIIPVPCELDTVDGRVSLWGVKWDVYPPDTPENDVREESIIHVLEIEPWPDGGGSIYFECDTAWDPPYKVLENVCSRGFHTTCFYRELNMNFGGEWRNGRDDQDECRFWPIPPDATRSMQEACKGVILGRPLLYFENGSIHHFQPESCGVLPDGDAVFGRPSHDLDGEELGEWQTLHLDKVDAVLCSFRVRSKVWNGLPNDVHRPPFKILHATTEAYRLNYEPVLESADD